jgi:mannose-6-phosphate isomerase-like protein (cupin superfamily)
MLNGPVSSASAERYRWGANCDGWRLVKGANLSVIEEQMPPGASEVMHYHRRAQQFFYVLAGTCVMETGQTSVHLSTGEGLHIPLEVRHRIRNESTAPVRFLVISQPESHGDRVTVER